MPYHKSLTSLFIDLIVFVSMFALLGHLSMNFWERFIIQTDFSNMKTSLHTLKETINRIGYAYDTLHLELTELAAKTENKQTAATLISKKELKLSQSKKERSLDRRTFNDMEIQAMIKERNATDITKSLHSNKTAQIFVNNKKDKTAQYSEAEKKNTKSASTMTRFPLKSTGAGLGSDEYKTDYNYNKYTKSRNNVEKCCKDRGCYNTNENWKF
ncbi:unnamed protein product [Chilo suppressalis]|uniref:Uncharacterized protein n=1 Tax=Chilo suppressalis TaxID=168631 RepID=A0ABN8AVI1_CHISP|nr:unnamed protein product [Chilo suppressalis]